MSFTITTQPNGLLTLFAHFDHSAAAGQATQTVAPHAGPSPAATTRSPAMATPSAAGGLLAWGARVSAGFRQKIRAIAGNLSTDPNFLMACMAFETGETFSPSKRNPVSGATGLIQFMPRTAVALGTTTEALAAMTAEAQLDFVAKYFAGKAGKLATLADVYMAILWPAAVGKPEDFVLFAKDGPNAVAYQQNRGLDINHDGKVTKAEAASKPAAMLTKGLLPVNAG